MMTHNQYLTVKEAASALGMGYNTVIKCVHAGAPVHYWGAGRHYRIVLDEFILWMDENGRRKKGAKPLQKMQQQNQ